MTKDAKQHAITQAKSDAFDRILELLLILDSHRNFHRKVDEEVKTTMDVIRKINRQSHSTSEQFPCMCTEPGCPNHLYTPTCASAGTIQVFIEDDETVIMCDRCANHALHSGIARVVEESVVLNPEDLQ